MFKEGFKSIVIPSLAVIGLIYVIQLFLVGTDYELSKYTPLAGGIGFFLMQIVHYISAKRKAKKIGE